jgi:hypothetical protein
MTPIPPLMKTPSNRHEAQTELLSAAHSLTSNAVDCINKFHACMLILWNRSINERTLLLRLWNAR